MKKRKILLMMVLIIISLVGMSCAKFDFSSIQYKIHFMVDGEIYHTVSTDGNKIAMPKDPEKADCFFDGWFYENGDNFTINSLLEQPIKEKNVIKLYANWSDLFVDISFETFGGSPIVPYTHNRKNVLDLQAFKTTKTGYTFEYFYKSERDQPFNEEQELKGDLTLNVKWKANTYKVIYDANGGTGMMPPTLAVYGESYRIDSKGFTFGTKIIESFNTKADGSGDRYSFNDSFSNLAIYNDEVVTLYAQWIEKYYILVFHSNDENNQTNKQNVGLSDGVVLSQTFERSGYSLQGYTIDKNAHGRIYKVGEVVQDLANHYLQEVTLYAVWKPNNYTIQFLYNGENYKQVFTYGESQNLRKNTFKKFAHRFIGWAYKGCVFNDEQSVCDLVGQGEITLTPLWNIGEVTIKYFTNKNESAFQQYNVPINGEKNFFIGGLSLYKTGYELQGFKSCIGTYYHIDTSYSVENIQPSEYANEENALLLYADWKPIEYKIKLIQTKNSNGNYYVQYFDAVYDQEFTLPQFSENVYEGYTPSCWIYEDATGLYNQSLPGDQIKNLTNYNNETVIIQAQFEPIKYFLRFDGCGGEGVIPDKQVSWANAFSLPSEGFAKKGYHFIGWQYDHTFYSLGAYNIDQCGKYQDEIIVFKAVYSYIYQGSGREQDPFIVDNPQAFLSLHNSLHDLNNQNSDKYYSITQDIDLQGEVFEPLCYFDGVIDGNKHTISNFVINSEKIFGMESCGYDIGFVCHNYGEIIDVLFDHVTLSIKDQANIYERDVGIFAGVNQGRIFGCQALNADIHIVSENDQGYIKVGGIFGLSQRYGEGSVAYCGFEGVIHVKSKNDILIGGICGSSNDMIDSCVVVADIQAESKMSVFVDAVSYAYTSDVVDNALVSACVVSARIMASGDKGVHTNDCTVQDNYISNDSTFVKKEGQKVVDIAMTKIDKAHLIDGLWYAENAKYFDQFSWVYDGVNYPRISKLEKSRKEMTLSNATELIALSGKELFDDYILTADIDLQGQKWIPANLYGNFDGKGHKISNYVIGDMVKGYMSFFSVNYGKISSVAFENFRILANKMVSYKVGGLVGLNRGMIVGVKVQGEMVVSTRDTSLIAAGLVAYNCGKIYSCYAIVNMEVTAGTDLKLGGLVAISCDGVISNCYISGSCTVNLTSDHYYSCIIGNSLLGSGCLGSKNRISNCMSDFVFKRKEGVNVQIVSNSEYKTQRNCYFAGSGVNIYSGERPISYFTDPKFLVNECQFYEYENAEKFSQNYQYAWKFVEGNFPVLYFEV